VSRLATCLAAAALAGCAGQSGTIAIEIVTAPGSPVLDEVTRVRMTLSRPYRAVEVERGADGSFVLAIDVTADGPSGDVLFEGFDAAGDLRAYGRTPPLPIAAIDAAIAIYVAAPMSLAAAPMELGTARTEIGVAPLPYGALLAGGRDAAGAPSDHLAIYSAYDHELRRGLDLPEPRAGVSVGTGLSGYVYLFGGEDAAGGARGTLWRFDTTIAPSGRWLEASEADTLARVGAGIAPLGSDAFLVTGDPPVLLEGLTLRASPIDVSFSVQGLAASVQLETLPGRPIYTVIAGEGAGATGILRLASGTITQEANAPATSARTGHAVVSTVSGDILIVGGRFGDEVVGSVIRATPAARSYALREDVLSTPRADAAVAATAAYLVVAGGRDGDGAVIPDAEILDVETLAPRATIPLAVPRAGAVARALPNQQVLIVGGVDADGVPVATLELFTPPPPARP
jgi:hypothetical protein